MKKRLLFLGALLLAGVSSSLFAQTLLYEASGNGTSFGKTSGTQNYALTLGGNSVQDGKLVISSGNTAPGIAISPAISAYAGGGVTVLMKVSHVDVTKGGQLLALGTGTSTLGGLKIKNGTTDGLLHATWQNTEWGSGTTTTTFPTDASTVIVGYSYIRNGEDGGKGSEFYLNGKLVQTFTGLQGAETVGNVVLGGILKEDSTFLNVGMQIHSVRIYAGRLTGDQMLAATGGLTGEIFDAELTSDGNGTVEFENENGQETIFSIPSFSLLSIVATPNSGYLFDKWVNEENETEIISTSNPYKFRISSNITYKGIFMPYAEKSVTVTTDGRGTTDKNGENKVVLTDNFTVTASANLGYVFDKWVNADKPEEVLSTANPFVYTSRNNLNLKATFKFTQIPATATPAANDGKWYFVRSGRTPNETQLWWTLKDTIQYAKLDVLTKEDNQKFTLISTVNDSVTFKSFDGKIMIGSGRFVENASPPAQGWKLTPRTAEDLQAFSFPGENKGIRQGGETRNWEIRSGDHGSSSSYTFFFYEIAADIELSSIYNEALQLYEGIIVSNYPGNFISEAPKKALADALDVAASKFGASDEERRTAITTLQAAIETLKSQKIKLVTSTAESPAWYMIKNLGSDVRGGKVVTTAGFDQVCQWSDPLPYAKEKLFRFEAHPSDSTLFRIINAAHPEGQLNGISYGSDSIPVYFRIIESAGNEGAKFRIVSTATTSSSNLLYSNNSGLITLRSNWSYSGDPSMWQFERYFLDRKLTLVLDTARTYAENAVVDGSAGNHKNQTDVDALKAAIATAESHLGSENEEQLTLAETALRAAIQTFENAANPIEHSTASAPIYYLIVSGMKDGHATNKAIYTVDDTSTLQWGDIEPLTTNKFFFFEKHATDSDRYRIVNGAYPSGGLEGVNYGPATNIYFDFVSHRGDQGAKFQILDGNRQLQALSTTFLGYRNNHNYNYNGTAIWKFVKLSDVLDSRYQELVTEMATLVDNEYKPIGFDLGNANGNYGQQEFDAMVVAYKALVNDKVSGGNTLYLTIPTLTTAIADFRASKVVSTSIDATNGSPLSVTVVSGTIVAVGSDAPVQVYTISGARVQNSNLTQGIYVAHVAGRTFKVLVK